MSQQADKYAPDDKHMQQNPLGKLLATLLFGVIGALLSIVIIVQFGNFVIPVIIILIVGFILLAVWLKNLYVYRYLIPAVVVMLVFLAYPIVYTVYIAFTNYGTGHMQPKNDAEFILLNYKWEVDQNNPELYAEFYAPEKPIMTFQDKWDREWEKFDEKMERKMENDNLSEDEIDMMWEKDFEDKTEMSLINSYLTPLDKKDFTIILYSEKKIEEEDVADQIAAEDEAETMDAALEDMENEEVDGEGKDTEITVYVVEPSRDKETFMKQISFSEIESYTNDRGLILVSDLVFRRDSVIKAEIPDFQYSFYKYYEKMREQYPLTLQTEDGKKNIYLVEFSNLFLNKRHTYVKPSSLADLGEELQPGVDPDGDYMLRISQDENGKYIYQEKVFDDDKYGRYVVTYDNEEPVYRNEYDLKEPEYIYGKFSIENNSEAEEFLENKKAEIGFDITINEIFTMIGAVTGKPKKNVPQADIDKLKSEIEKANEGPVKDFNREIVRNYKQEFKDIIEDRVIKSNLELEGFDPSLLERYNLEKLSINEVINLLSADEYEFTDAKAMSKFLVDNKNDIRNEINKKVGKVPLITPFKLGDIEVSNIKNKKDGGEIDPGYVVRVGLRNFNQIISNRNITTPFFRVFIWTVIWAIGSVLLSFSVGLVLALIFNSSDFKFRYLYRTILILPWAIPVFVSILMWQGLLNKDFGVVNAFFNIDVDWLQDRSYWGFIPKLSCMLINLWLSFPYFMVICLGALQSIDRSLYEVADVDGATWLQQFWMITLPLLLIAIGPMLVGSFAFTFNNFAGIYLLTGGGPVMKPGVLPGETDILISYTYKLAFGEQDKNYGLASAIAIIVFMIVGTITYFNFKYTGTFKEVDNA
jgi:ABC-type sugar transport system permease subunit